MNLETCLTFRKITVLCLSLLWALMSCSPRQSGFVAGDSTSGPTYMVKRAPEGFEPVCDWDARQWALADVLELTHYMGNKPKHFPKTQAKLLYDDDTIYVIFRVEDRYVRAVAEKTHDKVWRDSCVEFFFAPRYGALIPYFNLETNCGGTVLMYRVTDMDRKDFIEIDPNDCRKLEVASSLPRLIPEEITEPTTWTLSYKIPVAVLAQYCQVDTPAPGVQWRANFYKCGDHTSHPHWLTWSQVKADHPKFHRPEDFGTLVFSAGGGSVPREHRSLMQK